MRDGLLGCDEGINEGLAVGVDLGFIVGLLEGLDVGLLDGKEGIVLQVIQAGYEISNRLIRPALVAVSKPKNNS